MNKKIIVGVLVTCLLASVAVMAFGQNSQTVRWEYHIAPFNAGLATFNSLGAEGWEFVGTRSHIDGGNVFKRRLP